MLVRGARAAETAARRKRWAARPSKRRLRAPFRTSALAAIEQPRVKRRSIRCGNFTPVHDAGGVPHKHKIAAIFVCGSWAQVASDPHVSIVQASSSAQASSV